MPGALAVFAGFALAAAASLARAARCRARPAVALATALAFLAATTAECAKAASPPPVGPLAAVYYHGDRCRFTQAGADTAVRTSRYPRRGAAS